MKKQLIFLCALAVAATACNVEESGLNSSDFSTITVTASIESFLNSKSYYYDDETLFWGENDVILIYTSANRFYQMDVEEVDANTATFSGTISGRATGFGVTPYFGILPEYENEELRVYLPSSYDWEEQVVYSPMVSYTGIANNFNFKHVGGFFQITINGMPADATQMIISTGMQISGYFTVDGLGTDEPTISTEAATDEDSVTFTFELEDTTDMVFYVPVPTGNYPYLAIDVQNANNESLGSIYSESDREITRAYRLIMAALEFNQLY